MQNNEEKSYQKYKQYQKDKYRYKQEQTILPLSLILVICLLIEYWWLFLIISAVIIAYVCYKLSQRSISMKSTETGYVNKNNQKNLGVTNQQGTDYNQKFYNMQCLNCNYRYFSNGTDIWQRKCPKCQGGK